MDEEGKDGWWIKRKQHNNVHVPEELSERLRENWYAVGGLVNTVAHHSLSETKGAHGAITGAMVKLRLKDYQKSSFSSASNLPEDYPFPPPEQFPVLFDQLIIDHSLKSPAAEGSVSSVLDDDAKKAISATELYEETFFDVTNERKESDAKRNATPTSVRSSNRNQAYEAAHSGQSAPAAHLPNQWRDLPANKRFLRAVPHVSQQSPISSKEVDAAPQIGRNVRKANTFTEERREAPVSKRNVTPTLACIPNDASSLSEFEQVFKPVALVNTVVALRRKHSPVRSSRLRQTMPISPSVDPSNTQDDYMQFDSARRAKFNSRRMLGWLRNNGRFGSKAA